MKRKLIAKLLIVVGSLALGAAAVGTLTGYFEEKRDRGLYLASRSVEFDLESANTVVVQPLGLGVIEMPRLKLTTLIRPTTSDFDLARGIGHIEGTSLPGTPGTIALAGHRDTFFRGLRHVRRGDEIKLQSAKDLRSYTVIQTKIVEPTDVSVLRRAARDRVVLVTCYPFEFVGSAPQRFIVIAEPSDRQSSDRQPSDRQPPSAQ